MDFEFLESFSDIENKTNSFIEHITTESIAEI